MTNSKVDPYSKYFGNSEEPPTNEFYPINNCSPRIKHSKQSSQKISFRNKLTNTSKGHNDAFPFIKLQNSTLINNNGTNLPIKLKQSSKKTLFNDNINTTLNEKEGSFFNLLINNNTRNEQFLKLNSDLAKEKSNSNHQQQIPPLIYAKSRNSKFNTIEDPQKSMLNQATALGPTNPEKKFKHLNTFKPPPSKNLSKEEFLLKKEKRELEIKKFLEEKEKFKRAKENLNESRGRINERVTNNTIHTVQITEEKEPSPLNLKKPKQPKLKKVLFTNFLKNIINKSFKEKEEGKGIEDVLKRDNELQANKQITLNKDATKKQNKYYEKLLMQMKNLIKTPNNNDNFLKGVFNQTGFFNTETKYFDDKPKIKSKRTYSTKDLSYLKNLLISRKSFNLKLLGINTDNNKIEITNNTNKEDNKKQMRAKMNKELTITSKARSRIDASRKSLDQRIQPRNSRFESSKLLNSRHNSKSNFQSQSNNNHKRISLENNNNESNPHHQQANLIVNAIEKRILSNKNSKMNNNNSDDSNNSIVFFRRKMAEEALMENKQRPKRKKKFTLFCCF